VSALCWSTMQFKLHGTKCNECGGAERGGCSICLLSDDLRIVESFDAVKNQSIKSCGMVSIAIFRCVWMPLQQYLSLKISQHLYFLTMWHLQRSLVLLVYSIDAWFRTCSKGLASLHFGNLRWSSRFSGQRAGWEKLLRRLLLSRQTLHWREPSRRIWMRRIHGVPKISESPTTSSRDLVATVDHNVWKEQERTILFSKKVVVDAGILEPSGSDTDSLPSMNHILFGIRMWHSPFPSSVLGLWCRLEH